MFDVRAFLGEHRGDVVVAVDDRHDQRGRAVGIDQVQRRPGVDQLAGRAERALPRRIHQRRPAALGQDREDAFEAEPVLRPGDVVRAGIDVGAASDQQLDSLGMILRRGPHQRRFAERLFTGVRIGAFIEDEANGLGVAGPRRGHQDRLALPDRRLRVGARLEQQPDHGAVGVGGRDRQRRQPVPVRRIGVGASAHEQPGDLQIVAAHGPVQRRRSIGFGQVDVRRRRGRLEQRAHGGAVTGLDGLDQRKLASAGGQRDHRQKGNDPQRVLHGAYQAGPKACTTTADC